VTLREQKVILDADLAKIYGVPTGRLNEQVKRNQERFPTDFMFQLSKEEAEAWRSSRSQNAILKRGQNIKYLPYAFTDHGAIMAANVLNSTKAITMSLYIIRAFVRLREEFTIKQVLTKRLAEIEKSLVIHDTALQDLYKKIHPLLLSPPDPPRKKIGFRKD
jgi:hypothetical protein